jgi:hypothetical protein
LIFEIWSFLLILMHHCKKFWSHEWMKSDKKAKTWHIAQLPCQISVWELISISTLSQNSISAMIPGLGLLWANILLSFSCGQLLGWYLSLSICIWSRTLYFFYFLFVFFKLSASVTWVESPFCAPRQHCNL